MANLSEITKNAKKIKEQLAQQAGVETKDVNDKNLQQVSAALDGAQKVVQEGGDPTKADIGELKEIAGVKSGSQEDLSKQRKIAMALTAFLPALVGYSFGGAEGGAVGAGVGGKAVEQFGKMEEKEAEKQAAIAKQKTELESKKELKEMELAQRKEEAEARREDRRATQGIASEMAALRLQQQREGMQERAEKKAYSKSVEGRLEKLGIEGKARVDNAKLGLTAVQGMADSLLALDQKTFSMWGDNDFTQQRTLFEEALGRMQSGGAITKEEENRFKNMAPNFRDTPDIQRKKLKQLQGEMASRLNTLGFKPEELNVSVVDIDSLKPKKEGEISSPNLPKAQAAPAMPDFDKMTDEELKKYLNQ